MRSKKNIIFLLFPILSFIFIIINIKTPEYGGDELWFATSILFKKFQDLNLFEFVYAGPIKTILTYPVFKYVGFSIYTVRLFTISIYLITVFLWCRFLYKRKLLVACFSSLILFSLNPDLLYFAKADINQPTFNNLFFIVHLIIFLLFLNKKDKDSVSINYGLILLSLIESNIHIRNIWVMNSFLLTYILFFYFSDRKKIFSLSNLRVLLLKGWPIFIGWSISAFFFFYTLLHFKNNPTLITAQNLGGNISIFGCIVRSIKNIINYAIGSRIFSRAFAVNNESTLISIAGVFIIVLAIFLTALIIIKGRKNDNQQYRNIFLQIIVILLLITLQYSLTKSAIHPWHGNHFLILWVISWGLIFEGLTLIKLKVTAKVTMSLLVGILLTINIFMYQRTHSINPALTGWSVVFHPHDIDPIRDYINNHPDEYYVADWEIGRPLALENHYSKEKKSIVTLYLGNITITELPKLNGKLLIRSTDITRTVPNLSDNELAKQGIAFDVIYTFKDALNREIYQVGTVRKRQEQ